MEKLKLHSPDLVAQNIEKLAELFPTCVTEALNDRGTLKRSLDFDQLRQELAGHIVEGPRERYHLDWPGKREATVLANAPVAKTLRPCREESVNFETTRHLFIEGENLDALKLLLEIYLGEIKVIYIDPPYNSGGDFIYRDNFSESADSFFLRSEQKDDDGNRLTLNTEANGRFHSEWLSMIYPRIQLAHKLLRNDGVFFASIDDNEVANLRKICDEVFGPHNFCAQIVWEGAFKNDARQIGINHEYVLVYTKSYDPIAEKWSVKKTGVKPVLEEVERLRAKYGDDYESASADLAAWFRASKATPSFSHRRFRYIDKIGAYKEDDPTAPGGRRFELKNPKTGKVIPLRANRGWSFDQERFDQLVEQGRISFITESTVMVRRYLHETDRMTPQSVIYQPARSASERLTRLLGASVFDFPKDEETIAQLIDMSTGGGEEEIVLNFFAGAGTTAHAVMALNAQDGGKRRHITIQIAEPCQENSEAAAAGFKTIADITRERIRKAGAKVKSESGLTSPDLDIGFRTLRVDTSNMKDVYYTPEESKQGELLAHVANVKPDRNVEDLLFQVLVDWGVDLALPMVEETITGKTVFFVDGNALATCSIRM